MTTINQENDDEIKARKIVAYATSKEGDGYIQRLATYDDIDEIKIRVNMFAPDVIITFEYENE